MAQARVVELDEMVQFFKTAEMESKGEIVSLRKQIQDEAAVVKQSTAEARQARDQAEDMASDHTS